MVAGGVPHMLASKPAARAANWRREPAWMRHARTLDAIAQLQVRAAVMRTPRVDLGRWLSCKLQDLGPTYVKIGQFISSRSDIFGKDFSATFEGLRDQVTPIDGAEVSRLIEENLDLSLFDTVDLTPMASASIGQVHRGVLRSGKQVVIKLKRPGIEAVLREDIGFIGTVVGLLQVFFSERNYDAARSSISDLETYVMQEVDFRREASNIERFRKIYADDEDVTVPATVPSMCNDAVIVMEFVASTGVTDAALSPRRTRFVANKLMDLFVSQLVHKGLVHGDPHPGNLGFDDRGRIVLYDFGSVIEVSSVERQRMKEMIYQLLLGNNRAVVGTLKKLGVTILDEREIDRYIDLYREYMRTVDVSEIVAQHDPAVRLPLRLTDKLMRLIRVYGTLEGTCKTIHPGFNYFDMLDNYIDELFFDEEFVAYKVGEDVQTMTRSLGRAMGSITPYADGKDEPEKRAPARPPALAAPAARPLWQDAAFALLLLANLMS